MCGIVGFTGKQSAAPVLLAGLKKLEYRGYDSAGIALSSEEGGEPKLAKRAGRVKDLRELCKEKDVSGSCGIGHTRWATHGAPSDVNSHPHYNAEETIAVVHNGIIENYLPLKEKEKHYSGYFLIRPSSSSLQDMI